MTVWCKMLRHQELLHKLDVIWSSPHAFCCGAYPYLCHTCLRTHSPLHSLDTDNPIFIWEMYVDIDTTAQTSPSRLLLSCCTCLQYLSAVAYVIQSFCTVIYVLYKIRTNIALRSKICHNSHFCAENVTMQLQSHDIQYDVFPSRHCFMTHNKSIWIVEFYWYTCSRHGYAKAKWLGANLLGPS